jgi:cytochrome c oxidase cbb3-type subunit 3
MCFRCREKFTTKNTKIHCSKMNQEGRNAGNKSKVFLLSCFAHCFLFLLFCASCRREERVLVSLPSPDTQRSRYEVSVDNGGQSARVRTWFDQNSWSMAQGEQLYLAYNCVGCHAHGGGGMGPALMDDKWIYGSEPQQIYGSIIYGRPNGMPSFHNKIPDSQVWQIVAYVRSMSGLANQSAANARDDHLKGPPPPNSVPASRPRNASLPRSAQQPQ